MHGGFRRTYRQDPATSYWTVFRRPVHGGAVRKRKNISSIFFLQGVPNGWKRRKPTRRSQWSNYFNARSTKRTRQRAAAKESPNDNGARWYEPAVVRTRERERAAA